MVIWVYISFNKHGVSSTSHDHTSATSDTDEEAAVLHVRLNSLLQRASEEVFHSA